MRATTRAYAKINLSLDIVGKAPNNYHLLHSIFQKISLYDTITISAQKDLHFHCTDCFIPNGKENIAFKAAETFYKKTGFGASIILEKNIPSAAGLGGGSSDAATVLTSLNQLYHYPLSISDLLSIGAALGADIPFFIKPNCSSALVEGFGEKITVLPPLKHIYFLIVKPKVSFSTQSVYEQYDRRFPSRSAIDHQKLLKAYCKGDIATFFSHTKNVLENGIFHPDVLQIKEKLKKNYAIYASMTGSGSAVYGVFNNKSNADAAKTKLKSEFDNLFLCTPV